MKKEIQKNTVQPGGDTCNGVTKPTESGDWICDNGRWVKVDVPNQENNPNEPIT